MTIGSDILRTQLDYSHWANRRLIDIANQLTAEELARDFGTADKSVLGTLVHVYASERTWLRRLVGAPAVTFVTEADYRMPVIEEDWPALGQLARMGRRLDRCERGETDFLQGFAWSFVGAAGLADRAPCCESRESPPGAGIRVFAIDGPHTPAARFDPVLSGGSLERIFRALDYFTNADATDKLAN